MMTLNHDLHVHSTLSSCCRDAAMTPDAIVTHAKACGYDTVCLTNHLWDSAVPGASTWYETQDIAHLESALPLPQVKGVRFCFGCEVEFCGGEKLSLLPKHFDRFDFVIVSINHMHMKGLVRPEGVETPEQIAELFTRRAEELLALPLSFTRMGLAHLNTRLLYREGTAADVLRLCDPARWQKIFQRAAECGLGIELNDAAFVEAGEQLPVHLGFFALARDAGCRFYCGSDAHKVGAMSLSHLESVVAALGLTEQQRYLIP